MLLLQRHDGAFGRITGLLPPIPQNRRVDFGNLLVAMEIEDRKPDVWSWRIAPPVIAFCLACMLIPYAGLESDEAVFGMATFGGLSREFCVSIFKHPFPLMIFYYAGSLKGILYWPVLHLFGTNLWSIRLPMALAGAISVALFYDFAARIANRKVALIAALLLATDPCFIISNTFDSGPVAMEHLLLLSALVLFAGGRIQLACFFLGLGLWNKAIFTWALAGLAAGGLAAYWPGIRRSLPGRRAAWRCAASFLLGSAPLLLYNIRQQAATLNSSNVHLTFEGLGDKITSLRYTLDGSDFFGIVAGMDGVTSHSGLRFHNLFLPTLIVSAAFAVWRIRSREFRPAVFAMAFCSASFLLIALTKYAGAAHHIVLMYPMPQLIVATAVGSLRRAYLAGLLAVLLAGSNLLVFDTYLTQLRLSGSYGLFTDATGSLSNSLNDGTDHVYTIDYGMWENVWLLHRGKLRVAPIDVLVQPVRDLEEALRDPRAVFVDHLPGHEYHPGSADRMGEIARAMGLRRVDIRKIYDSKGRAQMEVFRYSGGP